MGQERVRTMCESSRAGLGGQGQAGGGRDGHSTRGRRAAAKLKPRREMVMLARQRPPPLATPSLPSPSQAMASTSWDGESPVRLRVALVLAADRGLLLGCCRRPLAPPPLSPPPPGAHARVDARLEADAVLEARLEPVVRRRRVVLARRQPRRPRVGRDRGRRGRRRGAHRQGASRGRRSLARTSIKELTEPPSSLSACSAARSHGRPAVGGAERPRHPVADDEHAQRRATPPRGAGRLPARLPADQGAGRRSPSIVCRSPAADWTDPPLLVPSATSSTRATRRTCSGRSGGTSSASSASLALPRNCARTS